MYAHRERLRAGTTIIIYTRSQCYDRSRYSASTGNDGEYRDQKERRLWPDLCLVIGSTCTLPMQIQIVEKEKENKEEKKRKEERTNKSPRKKKKRSKYNYSFFCFQSHTWWLLYIYIYIDKKKNDWKERESKLFDRPMTSLSNKRIYWARAFTFESTTKRDRIERKDRNDKSD